MTTFALLHGTWGVPAQWAEVARHLLFHGDRAIVVDLPIADPAATLWSCTEAIERALARIQGRVVVVAHSSSGYVATMLPALRPVDQLVFVSGLVPRPGRPGVVRQPGQALAEGRGDLELFPPAFRALMQERTDGTTTIDPDGLVAFLEVDPSDPVARSLAKMLRPTASRLFEEPWPLEALPAVPMSYLICGMDTVLPPEQQRAMAARASARLIELPEADHAAPLKLPGRIASALVEIAARRR